MHPVEPRAAGLLPPTVRPKGRRLSVVLILAMNEPQKPFEAGPPKQERFRRSIERYAGAGGR